MNPPRLTTSDDAALVASARSGDRAALEELLRRHHDRIWAICRRLAGNDADAADATQEALMAIVRGLDRFDGRARFTTWSYRVATNACLDEMRRRGRRPRPGLIDDDPGSGSVTPDENVDVGRTVSASVDVDAALRELPEDFRVAVVLRDLCELDYAEIADVLEIAPGTVRSRIARGRARLAEILGDDGNQDTPVRRPSGEPS
ncbi:MAG: RNA polymerase sigma factor [Acidimicrobiales bacterium]